LKCTVNFNFSRYLIETMNNVDSLGVGAKDLLGTTADVG